MQTSENCHPKKFLAVEIVVGEDKCTTVVKLLGKSDQQQFHVNSAADRFETRMKGGYFLLLGFRVLENDRTLYFLISSASVNNYNFLTCLHTCV